VSTELISTEPGVVSGESIVVESVSTEQISIELISNEQGVVSSEPDPIEIIEEFINNEQISIEPVSTELEAVSNEPELNTQNSGLPTLENETPTE